IRLITDFNQDGAPDVFAGGANWNEVPALYAFEPDAGVRVVALPGYLTDAGDDAMTVVLSPRAQRVLVRSYRAAVSRTSTDEFEYVSDGGLEQVSTLDVSGTLIPLAGNPERETLLFKVVGSNLALVAERESDGGWTPSDSMSR